MAREHRGPGCTGVRGLGHGPRLHQRRRRVVVAAAEKGETGSERVIDPPGPVAGHGRSPWPLCALKEWQSGRCRCRQKQQTTNPCADAVRHLFAQADVAQREDFADALRLALRGSRHSRIFCNSNTRRGASLRPASD